MAKHLTNFSEITLNQVSPFPMKATMELNSFVVMVGQNGIGKSYINKMIWLCASVINTIVGSASMGKVMTPTQMAETFQYFFSKTYITDHIEGSYELICKDPAGVITTSFKFSILNGIAEEVELITDIDTPTAPPMYMSTATRTFRAFEQYSTIKRLLGVDLSTPDPTKFDELCKSFPLYDILAIEQILVKLDNPAKVTQVIEFVNKFDPENANLSGIKYIYLLDGIVHVSGDAFTMKASSLADGEQAILMMTLGSV